MATPVSDDLAGPAVEFGGGNNIVNVILVDVRAWDTYGEVTVLIAAATGVASLIFLVRRTGRTPRRPTVATRIRCGRSSRRPGWPPTGCPAGRCCSRWSPG